MTQQSKEYAEALFMLAGEEGGDKAAYLAGLSTVLQFLESEERYALLLSSPAIPAPERVEAFREAFSSVLPETVLSFLCLLVERGSISLLPECKAHFEGLFLEEKAISPAKVVSAVELTTAEKEHLRAALEKRCGHQVTVEYAVDGSLLGGITVELDGQLLDGSLRSRLHDVKEVIDK